MWQLVLEIAHKIIVSNVSIIRGEGLKEEVSRLEKSLLVNMI